MSQIWLEKLRDAPTKVERDEAVLRDYRKLMLYLDKYTPLHILRLSEEVEDEIRALADLAFPK